MIDELATEQRAKHEQEPWLRGTHPEMPSVLRAALHALDLAKEDVEHWCAGLNDEQLNARPFELEPVSFHLRHMARSLDRLLTYAEGRQLSPEQIGNLNSELGQVTTRAEVLGEWKAAFQLTGHRLRAFGSSDLDEPRSVGKKNLLTTLGGLIVHIADHTQRHAGQLITTAKLVKGIESGR